MSGPVELHFEQPSKDTLKVILSGSWKLGEGLPSADDVRREAESTGPIRKIAFDTEKLEDWDSEKKQGHPPGIQGGDRYSPLRRQVGG